MRWELESLLHKVFPVPERDAEAEQRLDHTEKSVEQAGRGVTARIRILDERIKLAKEARGGLCPWRWTNKG